MIDVRTLPKREMIGLKFGKLTVIKIAKQDKRGLYRYRCLLRDIFQEKFVIVARQKARQSALQSKSN